MKYIIITCEDCGNTFKTGDSQDKLCPLCIDVDTAIQEDDIMQLRNTTQEIIENREHSNNIFKRILTWMRTRLNNR